MQPINFISSVSRAKHISFALWFRISLMLLLGTLVILVIVQVQPWYTNRSLVTQKKLLAQAIQSFDVVMKEQRLRIDEEKNIKTKLFKISHHTNHPKNPAQLLKDIKASLATHATIESITVRSKDIEIKIAAPNSAALTKIAQSVSAGPSYSPLCITALEGKEKNSIIGILKTHVTTKTKNA
jgi:hypothetical protein